ncbi:MAG: PIN domain-containing protein, partial [Spirochaetaceae bacterium]
MRLTLDTNAYTAFCLGEDQVLQLMESADELLVPAVVIGELVSGFVQGSRKQENLDLLDEFLAQPGVLMQPIARREADRFGLLIKALRHAGTPIPTNDIWIAAAALCADAAVLTRDSHFDYV